MSLLFLPSAKRTLWLTTSAVLTVGAGVFYWIDRQRGEYQHGGTPAGLALGAAGLLLILLMLLFGWRKRAYSSRIGTLEGWMQAHVWLGLLTLPVVLLHTAFRFRDQLAIAAFVLLALVVATGWLGAVLYSALPARLTQVETKVSLAEASEQLNNLLQAMAQLAIGRSPAFVNLHQKLIFASRPSSFASWRLLFGGAGQLADSESQWQALLALVEEEERGPLRQLLGLARQHRELHHRLRLQHRYRNVLAAWLLLHVPLSILLLLVTIAHVVVAMYYRGL